MDLFYFNVHNAILIPLHVPKRQKDGSFFHVRNTIKIHIFPYLDIDMIHFTSTQQHL